jgi:GH25 family lysozyme M1 (1,4-beta-N-acetylmuramidase)
MSRWVAHVNKLCLALGAIVFGAIAFVTACASPSDAPTATEREPSASAASAAAPSSIAAIASAPAASVSPPASAVKPPDPACRDLVSGKQPGAAWKPVHVPPARLDGRARGFDTSSPAAWATLTKAGFSFAYVQAALGSRPNEAFRANWTASKACGIPRGAYQFVSPTEDGAALARVLASELDGDAGELPPTLDLEKPPSCADDCCERSCTDWTIRAGAWVTEIERLTKKRAALYVVEPFFARCLCASTKWSDRPLWLAAWPRFDFPERPRLGGFAAWDLYQFEGNVVTFGGVVDLSLFRGDDRDLAKWIEAERLSP